MLFLIVLGGAACLEVHRALHHNGNPDVRELREREASLRRQLQDIQKDLQAAQRQRHLTEQEASQLAAVNQRLSAENKSLSSEATSLRAENEALAERAAVLESCSESLRLENTTLIQQFDRLKVKYEAEASGFREQVAELKSAVSGVLGRFTSGDISADDLMRFLSQMGVELRCRKEDLESLPEQLNSARSTEERIKLLDRAEVEVSDNWMTQMRLVSAEPGYAARLLMAGAAAARTANGQPTVTLLEGAEASSAAAAGGSNVFSPLKKLPTPPKERPAAQLPAVKVPPLKIGSSGGAAMAAAPSSSSSGQDENAPATNQKVAQLPAPQAAEKAAAVAAKPKKAVHFVSGKKVVKKQSGAPSLALDVPLSQSGSSAMPRLPFDAAHDDMDLRSGSGSIMSI